MESTTVKLTEYSHGAGCGCKIAPDVLSRILAGEPSEKIRAAFPELLVGHHSRDDAAAVELPDGQVILSTTDFFMPVVDDPYDFGRIAATNAISDIYAMGGRPLVAVAILGWPVNVLDPAIANLVIRGGRDVCSALGFALAGGHSIDAPEPIFGLAVTGIVPPLNLKLNSAAKAGDCLLLTKPIGIGIHTTAEKQRQLLDTHQGLATKVMCEANTIGAKLSEIGAVHALTDVTGFGLAGHLLEVCNGAGLDATLNLSRIPELPGLDDYIAKGCVPGGTERNHAAYGTALPDLTQREKALLCDPQTSGGLLIAVSEASLHAVQAVLHDNGLPQEVIGALSTRSGATSQITLSSM
jgi:selenide,water dikinase